MSRLDRLRRVAAALDTRERHARQEMATANQERDEATRAVESVLDQCRQVGGPAGSGRDRAPLPVAVAHAVIQAGLREATDRELARDDADRRAEETQMLWHDAHRRQEAVSRLTERWRRADSAESDRRDQAALEDLIAARTHRPGPGDPMAPNLEEHR